jgi:hypothetical protein
MYQYVPVHTAIQLAYTGMYQVELINRAIDNANPGSCLHCLSHVSDPSNEVVEVLMVEGKRLVGISRKHTVLVYHSTY